MTDIAGLVERLRDHAAEPSYRVWERALFNEAANALERLAELRGTENVLAEGHIKRLHDELTAAKAEIAQLRSQVGDNIELQEAEQRGYARAMDARENNAWYQTALRELRAENERLRAALSPPLEQEVKYLDGQIKMLLAENKAMRAALEKIANVPDDIDAPHYPIAYARAALTGRGE